MDLSTTLTSPIAIVGNSHGSTELSHNAPIAQAKDDVFIIQTKAISVNPVDSKMTGEYVTAGAIGGCDFAGVVEAMGPDAARWGFQVGDRVCGTIMGMNPLEPNHGAFAQHVGAHGNALLRIPDAMSFEVAAALGTCFMTSGLALFQSLQLPGTPVKPSTSPIQVLVYGGATATGTAAIQLLRLAGFTPIVTCSPHSNELVMAYGAEAAFDYKDPDCASKIRAYSKNGLHYALDCITSRESMQICYASLSRVGGRYTALDPYPADVAKTRKIVKADWVLGPIMLGMDIGWPAPHGRKADAELFKFGLEWTSVLQSLMLQGLVREHPLEVQEGGLEKVIECMDDIRAKRVSGKKLVVKLLGEP
ncbi:putative zinc-binding dehydrogenase family oxidoreductase [Periconia macrospinosa]|uniref:Putative zinc-binding dehydrogenase family oxidoreductase n=1 Tax=Periconia macrospinosa TaxID=97972 RepID=A0A2V1DX38_9PLEO|nr:putative zinc-binding dehydrogenase family oxidoreductase [Periconia macrospinosa]